jgi:hypothetical protein
MRFQRPYGCVQGVRGDSHPYRERMVCMVETLIDSLRRRSANIQATLFRFRHLP